MKRILFFVALALLAAYATIAQAQTAGPVPYFTYGKGLGITAPDSLFSINIRFRMQNRFALQTESEDDLSISQVEARVRRLRLRFDGFVYSPRITYLIQLGFSRGDMDYEAMNFPNIIRDAYIQYAFTKKFSVGFGQTKLPGNRQRINSSGDLQFVDRSLVNATFNIDRDFGIQFQYKTNYLITRGAISSGEGRNINASDAGLAYTGRVEVLPMGAFTNGGEYFEGDLAREKKPKVSIGVAYSHNEDATRTGGQLGPVLYGSTDIKTAIVDFLYKYNGWSFATEYINRTAPNPVTTNAEGAVRFVYTGSGQNYQGGYNFKNNFEIVGRYSVITPGKDIEQLGLDHKKEQFMMGANKYIKGHRVKIQTDLALDRTHLGTTFDSSWIYRFQVELGI
jgi:phosphate-selective porin OprO/OprP